jgi:hypothetical protein
MKPQTEMDPPNGGGLGRLSWEPWEGSQTLPRGFAVGQAGRLRTR